MRRKKTHPRKGCGWLACRRVSEYEKKTHRHKGCGWLASRRGSEYKKAHLCKGCGWLASRRGSKYKTNIVPKDVVGLLVGDSKNDSLTKMKTY